jgi:hypothetical protein
MVGDALKPLPLRIVFLLHAFLDDLSKPAGMMPETRFLNYDPPFSVSNATVGIGSGLP